MVLLNGKEELVVLDKRNLLELDYYVVSFYSTGYSTSAEIFEANVNPYCGYCRDQVENWNRMLIVF